eukprot:gene11821-13045_t
MNNPYQDISQQVRNLSIGMPPPDVSYQSKIQQQQSDTQLHIQRNNNQIDNQRFTATRYESDHNSNPWMPSPQAQHQPSQIVDQKNSYYVAQRDQDNHGMNREVSHNYPHSSRAMEQQITYPQIYKSAGHPTSPPEHQQQSTSVLPPNSHSFQQNTQQYQPVQMMPQSAQRYLQQVITPFPGMPQFEPGNRTMQNRMPEHEAGNNSAYHTDGNRDAQDSNAQMIRNNQPHQQTVTDYVNSQPPASIAYNFSQQAPREIRQYDMTNPTDIPPMHLQRGERQLASSARQTTYTVQARPGFDDRPEISSAMPKPPANAVYNNPTPEQVMYQRRPSYEAPQMPQSRAEYYTGVSQQVRGYNAAPVYTSAGASLQQNSMQDSNAALNFQRQRSNSDSQSPAYPTIYGQHKQQVADRYQQRYPNDTTPNEQQRGGEMASNQRMQYATNVQQQGQDDVQFSPGQHGRGNQINSQQPHGTMTIRSFSQEAEKQRETVYLQSLKTRQYPFPMQPPQLSEASNYNRQFSNPSSYNQSSTSYNQPSTSYNQPSTSYNQPSTSYNQPSTSYNQPSTSYNQPSTSYNQPSSSYNQPSTSYNQPGASYNQLFTNYAEQRQENGYYTQSGYPVRNPNQPEQYSTASNQPVHPMVRDGPRYPVANIGQPEYRPAYAMSTVSQSGQPVPNVNQPRHPIINGDQPRPSVVNTNVARPAMDNTNSIRQPMMNANQPGPSMLNANQPGPSMVNANQPGPSMVNANQPGPRIENPDQRRQSMENNYYPERPMMTNVTQPGGHSTAAANANNPAFNPSAGSPIVIMAGLSAQGSNPVRTTQANFEPKLHLIFQNIKHKQGLAYAKLSKIVEEVLDIQGEAMTFNGRRGDQNYILVEEMLTRKLLALDSIQTDGEEDVRLTRRSVVRQVQGLLSVLERRAKT